MSTIRWRHTPCSVLWPDGSVWHRVFVVLAEGERSGLHVFRRPSDEADRVERVNWLRMPERLASARQARNGMVVYLTDGRVVTVTAGHACRCGALGRWPGPAWAHTVRVG